MNELLKKVLTERSAREPEEAEAFATTQNEFEIWD
jgi:hypothetical protein